ncbi:hypothetical protein AREALGSMS7_01917 [Arenibacter algicola]|uniref:Uncharacterized protein n=1 Tax=Arenibacter algicola TaxID=616991 RepID=A0A221UVW3_9FLAO|nr:hypothetical protein AREALGSMS7_01917 [Arenibacter algicola]
MVKIPLKCNMIKKNRFYQFSHSQNEYNLSKEKAK